MLFGPIQFRSFKSVAGAIVIASFMGMSTAMAQSGTRARAMPSTAPARSAPTMASRTVGLQGHCPVCVVEMKKWMKGNPQIAVSQDGKTYLFPGEEQKQMFLKSPAKYTPVLGGDCAVALVDQGQRIPGNLNFGAIHNGRLYLFVNEKAKGTFLANRDKYADADLALGGKCSVCRVEMGKEVNGDPEFVTLYQGMRYQFPGREQQQMFSKNPGKYAVQTKLVGSGTR